MRIIEPTGQGDVLSPRGHRHVGYIDPDDVGTLDFFTEHALEVAESVPDRALVQQVLECGQHNEKIVLG